MTDITRRLWTAALDAEEMDMKGTGAAIRDGINEIERLDGLNAALAHKEAHQIKALEDAGIEVAFGLSVAIGKVVKERDELLVCFKASEPHIRALESEAAELRARVAELAAALRRIDHEATIRRPEDAQQTVADLRAIALAALEEGT